MERKDRMNPGKSGFTRIPEPGGGGAMSGPPARPAPIPKHLKGADRQMAQGRSAHQEAKRQSWFSEQPRAVQKSIKRKEKKDFNNKFKRKK